MKYSENPNPICSYDLCLNSLSERKGIDHREGIVLRQRRTCRVCGDEEPVELQLKDGEKYLNPHALEMSVTEDMAGNVCRECAYFEMMDIKTTSESQTEIQPFLLMISIVISPLIWLWIGLLGVQSKVSMDIAVALMWTAFGIVLIAFAYGHKYETSEQLMSELETDQRKKRIRKIDLWFQGIR